MLVASFITKRNESRSLDDLRERKRKSYFHWLLNGLTLSVTEIDTRTYSKYALFVAREWGGLGVRC